MCLALAVRQPSFEKMDHSIVEASSDLGASPLRTFCTVSLPMVGAPVVSAILFAFITSLNESVMAIFQATPNSQTLAGLLSLSVEVQRAPAWRCFDRPCVFVDFDDRRRRREELARRTKGGALALERTATEPP